MSLFLFSSDEPERIRIIVYSIYFKKLVGKSLGYVGMCLSRNHPVLKLQCGASYRYVYFLAACFLFVGGCAYPCLNQGSMDSLATYRHDGRANSPVDDINAPPSHEPVMPASHTEVDQYSQEEAGATGAFLSPENDLDLSERAVHAVYEHPITSPSLASSDLQEDTEANRGWTLESVLQYTLRHQPLLRARQCEVQAARAKLIGAGLLTNPRLVIDNDNSTNGDPSELRGRIMFEIPFGAKRRARRAVACAGIQRAQVALSRETENVLLESADAATEVLYLQDLLMLRKQISQLAAKKAGSKTPNLNRQMVRLNLSDCLKADLEAADCEAEQMDVENRLRVARLRLARSIALPPSTELRMEGHLAVDAMPLESLETMLAQSNKAALSIDEAYAALTESQQRYRLAWAEGIPNMEMGPRYGDELGTSDKQVGARFESDLPIFDRNQDEIWQRGAEIQANCALLHAARNATRSDIARAYAELESLRDRIVAIETGTMKRLGYYENLLRDPNTRQGITDAEATEVSKKSLEWEVKHLELCYRYARLYVRLQILFGNDTGCR